MKIRSFIAISLPADIRRELARIETELRKGAGAPVKWVETANLHLTLKFLGDIEFENIPAILDAMYKAAGTTGPLNMELNGLGVFPSPRRVRIVWVGLGGETEKLAALQQRLEISLEPLGFARESREFQPHLTIGRVREQAGPAEREAIGDRVRSFTSPGPLPFIADAVYLMKSVLTPSGPIYSELGKVSLA